MSHSESGRFVRAVVLAAPRDRDDTLLWSAVAGRPLLAWSLAALSAAPEIGPIVLVVPRSRLGAARRLLAAEGLADITAVAMPRGATLADLSPQPPLPRGEGEAEKRVLQERGEGEAEAVGAHGMRPVRGEGEAEADAGVIVLHDAARPLVPAEQIQKIVMAATETGFAVSAEPVKETIKRVADGRVVETLPRDELAQLIPPLAVRADVLPALLDASIGGRPHARLMDLVAAALALGIAVRAVPLAGESIAVTSPEDLAVAEALLGTAGG